MALLPEPRSSSFKFSLFTTADADTEAAKSAFDTARLRREKVEERR